MSGAPIFFKRPFGDIVSEFEMLLLRPHRYIFNRDWYEKLLKVVLSSLNMDRWLAG